MLAWRFASALNERFENPRREAAADQGRRTDAGRSSAPVKNGSGQKKGHQQKKPETKRGWGISIITQGTRAVAVLILIYACFVANLFRKIMYPDFRQDVQTFENIVQTGDEMLARLWVSPEAFPKLKAHAEFEFKYLYDSFPELSKEFNVNISQVGLRKGLNVVLSAEVKHKKSGRGVRAVRNMVRRMKKPDIPPKFKMWTGQQCPEEVEPAFGKESHIGRGIPKMQVRLVYDTTAYPGGLKGPEFWFPDLFVDELGMTDDALVKLNSTGVNMFKTHASFSVMSAARQRFRRHMEFSFSKNAELFGEDTEEMLQMRDLFANTNVYLLIGTLVFSVLRVVFELSAFKHDVIFFQSCDTADLNKFISVQSIAVGILMQILVLMYLIDEGSNSLVTITSVVAILIDAWKVHRANRVCWGKFFGFLPVPMLQAKVKRDKTDDFDSIAMEYLALVTLPFIAAYGVYTFTHDCHKGWYSFFLSFAASCVYSLGFVLMAPQVFINYKHKTVAYLPWRKLVYRSLNAFIDDLLASIIRMPAIHRRSGFRDDIVVFIYLCQRQIYKVDRTPPFDEDMSEIADDKEESRKDL